MSGRITGANSDEVTPVPIPNTEVKLISVDDTARPLNGTHITYYWGPLGINPVSGRVGK